MTDEIALLLVVSWQARQREGGKNSKPQLVKLSQLLAWEETDLDALYYLGLVELQYIESQRDLVSLNSSFKILIH